MNIRWPVSPRTSPSRCWISSNCYRARPHSGLKRPAHPVAQPEPAAPRRTSPKPPCGSPARIVRVARDQPLAATPAAHTLARSTRRTAPIRTAGSRPAESGIGAILPFEGEESAPEMNIRWPVSPRTSPSRCWISSNCYRARPHSGLKRPAHPVAQPEPAAPRRTSPKPPCGSPARIVRVARDQPLAATPAAHTLARSTRRTAPIRTAGSRPALR